MNERLQTGKLNRLRVHLAHRYEFTIQDIMRIMRIGKTRAHYYRNKLLAEGFIDVSHGANGQIFFKLTRKNHEDQKPTNPI